MVPRSTSIGKILKRRPLSFALLLIVPATAVAAMLVAPATRDAAAPPSAPAPVGPTMLGVNVGGVNYYSGDRAFMNLAQGSEWGILRKGVPGGTSPDPSRLDADGMVISLQPDETATKLLVPPAGAYYGDGPVRIRCTWQGKGDLRPGLAATKTSYGKNGFEFDWPPANKPKADIVNINLSRTDPADPLRRIDCREKTASPTALFAPQFLEFLSGYKVLRFMDWQNVNANLPATWATRPRPESDYQGGTTGVALENMVALSNAVGADPWFTMPWNADDDYVRRFATYVRDNLSPRHKVYVETGNEVWNWMFPVTKQAHGEGLAEGLAEDENQAMMRRYAEKSIATAKIWSDVFKATPDRLIRVMAFQNGNMWAMEKALEFPGALQHVDAIASAPYFGYAAFERQRAGITDPDNIFAYLDAEIDKVLAQAVEMRAVATGHGKRYIAYEGGQHLVNQDNVALVERLNRDPRMHDLYRKYLSVWQSRIGDVMALYSSHGAISKFGAWGMREYTGQPLDQTPKRRAVMEFLKAAPQASAEASGSEASFK